MGITTRDKGVERNQILRLTCSFSIVSGLNFSTRFKGETERN